LFGLSFRFDLGNSLGVIEPTCSAAAEDWDLLQSFFPPGWEDLARTTQALKGLRQDKSPANLLRTLLLHVGCGYSLRETVVRARQAGLADLSDVALLKRLRKSEHWLHALSVGLWAQRALPKQEHGVSVMRLIDATTVREPGKTGSLWRIHYSLQIPSLRCDFFKVTSSEGAGTGEGFGQISVQKGEYLIADRGYSNTEGIDSVDRSGAFLTVRLNQGAVRVVDGRGRPVQLLPKLERLTRPGQVGSWTLALAHPGGQVTGRICALRKTQVAIDTAQRKLKQEAKREARQLKPETLEFAKFITVFTTFPKELFPPAAVLEAYRTRWQVELVFKRFKQLAQLGHLPKHDDESARSWLYGKLIVALLTEKLVQHASTISPWGYELPAPAPTEKSVA
jgi:hypothetical protein